MTKSSLQKAKNFLAVAILVYSTGCKPVAKTPDREGKSSNTFNGSCSMTTSTNIGSNGTIEECWEMYNGTTAVAKSTCEVASGMYGESTSVSPVFNPSTRCKRTSPMIACNVPFVKPSFQILFQYTTTDRCNKGTVTTNFEGPNGSSDATTGSKTQTSSERGSQTQQAKDPFCQNLEKKWRGNQIYSTISGTELCYDATNGLENCVVRFNQKENTGKTPKIREPVSGVCSCSYTPSTTTLYVGCNQQGSKFKLCRTEYPPSENYIRHGSEARDGTENKFTDNHFSKTGRDYITVGPSVCGF